MTNWNRGENRVTFLVEGKSLENLERLTNRTTAKDPAAMMAQALGIAEFILNKLEAQDTVVLGIRDGKLVELGTDSATEQLDLRDCCVCDVPRLDIASTY